MDSMPVSERLWLSLNHQEWGQLFGCFKLDQGIFLTSQINVQLPCIFWRFPGPQCHCLIWVLEMVCGCACVRVCVHVYIGVFACVHICKYHFLAKVKTAKCQLGIKPILLCSGKTHGENLYLGYDKSSIQSQQKPSHPILNFNAGCDSSELEACSLQRTWANV